MSFSAFAEQDVIAEKQLVRKDKLHASISFGYGGIETPIKQASNFITPILPHLAYYGERGYFDDFSLGYALLEDRNFYVDISTRFNEDGFLFELDGIDKLFATVSLAVPNRGELRPNSPKIELTPIKRNLSYLGGLAAGVNITDDIWVNFEALQDLTNTHNGHEFQLDGYKVINLGAGVFGFGLAVHYKSKELVDYYYRVREGEVSVMPANYTLSNALNYVANAHYEYPISVSWSVTANLKHTWLDSKLANSPIIAKRTYFSGFAGIKYRF